MPVCKSGARLRAAVPHLQKREVTSLVLKKNGDDVATHTHTHTHTHTKGRKKKTALNRLVEPIV